MIDTNTSTWESIVKKAKLRIQELREENDNDDLTEKETTEIRGRIIQLKELIEWPNESVPLPEVESVHYID